MSRTRAGQTRGQLGGTPTARSRAHHQSWRIRGPSSSDSMRAISDAATRLRVKDDNNVSWLIDECNRAQPSDDHPPGVVSIPQPLERRIDEFARASAELTHLSAAGKPSR